MTGRGLFALPKDPGKGPGPKFRSLMELLIQEKARPRGVDLVAAGKCPYGANLPVACMFCEEGHILDCHAGQTCGEARCSHYLQEVETSREEGIIDLIDMEREARP